MSRITDIIQEAMSSAVTAAAAQLQEQPGALRERDLEAALQAHLEAEDSVGEVERQFSLRLGDLWAGRVGPVDLAITAPEVTLVEVKWSAGELPACAWDCAKLAAALVTLENARGFLVASSPGEAWDQAVPGAEFFSDRDWSLGDLLDRYAQWFAFWREDVANYPRRLPSGWRTREVPGAAMDRGEESWRLRITEIVITDRTLRRVAYVPTLAIWMRGEHGSAREPPRTPPRHEHAELPEAPAEQRLLLDANAQQRGDGVAERNPAEIFYAEDMSREEKREALVPIAEAGDTEAESYLASLAQKDEWDRQRGARDAERGAEAGGHSSED